MVVNHHKKSEGATALKVKEGALPTGSTGSGIEGRIPPVDLWACATEARKEFKMN
jgi:hypothetical protein